MTAYRVMKKTPPGRSLKKPVKLEQPAKAVKPSTRRGHNAKAILPFGRPAR